jgi:hypothetical protein
MAEALRTERLRAESFWPSGTVAPDASSAAALTETSEAVTAFLRGEAADEPGESSVF